VGRNAFHGDHHGSSFGDDETARKRIKAGLLRRESLGRSSKESLEKGRVSLNLPGSVSSGAEGL